MRLFVILTLVLVLTGCGTKIIPQQVPGGTIDLGTGSQTVSSNGVTISANVQDLQYAPYRQVDNITSFFLSVKNSTSSPWKFPFEKLLLVADDGRQHTAISPVQVKELVSRDLPYMVPYPYVGYYYLEDAQKGSYFNSFSSDLPYYAANNPQDIFTQALPEDAIQPGNHIEGLVYFIADLESMSWFKLTVPLPDDKSNSPKVIVYPFAVEK